MKKTNQLFCFLLVALLGLLSSISVHAQQPIRLRCKLSADPAAVGEAITLVVGMDGQTDPSDTFMALQLDIENVDTAVLTPESYASLLPEDGAMSNKASYQPDRRLLRMVYFQAETAAQYVNNQDVYTARLRLNPQLTEGGSITLPMTLKLQMSSGERIVQTGEIVIRYTTDAKPVTSVDITWGAMEYAYSDGVWNAQTHLYEGTGWADNGTGFVTVQNNGDPVQAEFVYTPDRKEIAGSFVSDSKPLTKPLPLGTGQKTTVRLLLEGKPSGSLDRTKLGTVTVRMGGN